MKKTTGRKGAKKGAVAKSGRNGFRKEIASFALVALLLLPGAAGVPAAVAQTTGSVLDSAYQPFVNQVQTDSGANLVQQLQQARIRLNLMWNLLNQLYALLQIRQAEEGLPAGAMRADIKANGSDGPVFINSGASVNLTWDSSGASSCKGTSNQQDATAEWGMSLPASGSQTIANVIQSTVFRIGCANVLDSVIVNVVGQPAAENITVTAPNGGETYEKGDTVLIRWGIQNINSESRLEIDLFKADGTLVYNLGSSVNPLTGSQVDSSGAAFSWAIPRDGAPGGRSINPGQYKIRIVLAGESSIYDESDSYFTIIEEDREEGNKLPVDENQLPPPYKPGSEEPTPTQTPTPTVVDKITVTSPNGGESWPDRSSQTIRWTTPSEVKTVDLKLVRVDGLTKNIVTGYNNTGSYTWRTGDVAGGRMFSGNYKITVCTAGTATCDSSDSYFYIGAATAAGEADNLLAAAGQLQSILDSLNALLRLRY